MREIVRNIRRKLANIDYSVDKSVQLQEQLLKRLDYQNKQLELTNNILLEMVQSESKEELIERVQMLIGRGY